MIEAVHLPKRKRLPEKWEEAAILLYTVSGVIEVILIEIQCPSCQTKETISFHAWPFEQASGSCKTCGATISESQKQAMDGCINYYRLANKGAFHFQLKRVDSSHNL